MFVALQLLIFVEFVISKSWSTSGSNTGVCSNTQRIHPFGHGHESNTFQQVFVLVWHMVSNYRTNKKKEICELGPTFQE
jgi:hypothetical protein